MKILFTNIRLDTPGGTQGIVRDFCLALQERGHQVAGFTCSPYPGERIMAEAGLEVYREIDDLPWQPDIIHGHHYGDSLAAILSLPGVPAIYYCHGGTTVETPPRHPRILRYLAMSRTLRERLLIELCLAEEQIEVMLNSFDPRGFQTVRTPRRELGRALFYNGFHKEKSPTLAAIRTACERLGITLDCAGRGAFRKMADPAAELPEYDVVFASGKSAIDALACGCTVAVLGRDSCGPLVSTRNLDQLRQVNFSVAANCPPPTADQIAEILGRYDPADAAEVTRRVRQECDISRTVDDLEALYREVVRESREYRVDAAAELSAAAQALRKMSNYIKMVPEGNPRRPDPLPTPRDLKSIREFSPGCMPQLPRAMVLEV